ncbi:MAG: 7-cyano-7-deazaguanine synthase [Candidatus Aenigmatarchaeota archaeon]
MVPTCTSGTRVVAIVSGGLDSFCSLVYWLSRGYSAHVLHFNYGHKASSREQRAVEELINDLNKLARVKNWGFVEKLLVLDMSFMKNLWRGTQLVDESVEIKDVYDRSVVVPVRNVVMITLASAYAYNLLEQGLCSRAIVVLGSQYSDVEPREDTGEPKYPDCSPECFAVLESALKVCHFRDKRNIEIWAPSREMLRKSDLLKICYQLVGDLVYKTYSCYSGGENHCGRCESCINRKRAFREAGIPDMTRYVDISNN